MIPIRRWLPHSGVLNLGHVYTRIFRAIGDEFKSRLTQNDVPSSAQPRVEGKPASPIPVMPPATRIRATLPLP